MERFYYSVNMQFSIVRQCQYGMVCHTGVWGGMANTGEHHEGCEGKAPMTKDNIYNGGLGDVDRLPKLSKC